MGISKLERKQNKILKHADQIPTKPEKEKVNIENVIDILSESSICKLCTINFTNNQTKTGLDDIFSEFELHYEEQQPLPEQCCYLCLGILEEHNLWSVAKTITERIAHCNSLTFSLGVEVPKSILLHRLVMASNVEKKLNDLQYFNVNCMVLVKTVARYFLSKLITTFSSKTMVNDSELIVKVRYSNCNDHDELTKITSPIIDNKKRKLSFSSFISNLKLSDIEEYSPDCLVENSTFEIDVIHLNIYLTGRYNKYCRSISDSSAQKLITDKLKDLTNAVSVSLITTGVDDYDVKILGNGKPFLIELKNPKLSNLDDHIIKKCLDEINSLETVSISNLIKSNKNALQTIKSDSSKILYSAKLSSSAIDNTLNDDDILRLNDMKDFIIEQAVPIRLLDSMPYDSNQVCIHEINLRKEGELYNLRIKVSSGCHIKEFIHGDLGRTEPSLNSILGISFEILQLDLLDMMDS